MNTISNKSKYKLVIVKKKTKIDLKRMKFKERKEEERNSSGLKLFCILPAQVISLLVSESHLLGIYMWYGSYLTRNVVRLARKKCYCAV